MNSDQLSVLRKIIYAVETGGQVYGSVRYDDFTEAYTNSSIEYAITIGGGAWYATEALKLLRNIYAKDSNLFTDSLLYDMNNKNWNNYAISKNSENAKTIVKIISSEIGKKCQDDLLDEQLIAYCNQAEQLGITDQDAQAMSANWQHQGGLGAVKRILAKTAKPYNLDNLYAACCTDTEPNQVGSFRQRQHLVYQWLKQYMPTDTSSETESTSNVSAETILSIMRSWIGLSMSDGSHAPIINIYNSHRPLARGWTMHMDDDYCACTVSAAFIKANAVDLIGGTEVGVERFIEDVFKPKGIWIEDDDITPLPGDIICFYWNEFRKEVDNKGFGSHIGIVEYVENGIIHTIEGNSTNGTVLRRQYEIGQACIRGFARPKYGTSTASDASGTPQTTTQTSYGEIDRLLKKGLSGDDVRALQTMLVKCGYDIGDYGIDADFGNDTEVALKQFQKEHNLEVDGVYGPKTKLALEASYENAEKDGFPKTMYTVKDPITYLRSGASKHKSIIKKLPVGTKVTAKSSKINSAGNTWLKVEYGTYQGWIVSTALRY